MRDSKHKKEFHLNLRLLAKTSAIVFIGIFLSKLLGYTYRVIIARSLGPEIYGLFSLALSIVLLFVTIASFGFLEGTLRFVPIYRAKKSFSKITFLVKYTISKFMFGGIISMIILFFSAEFIAINIFHNPNLIFFLKGFSILVPLFLFTNLFLALLRSFEEISWHSFIFNILQNIVKVLFLIILIILGFKSGSIIFSTIFSVLAMLIASYWIFKRKISPLIKDFKPDNKVKKEFLSYSWPIMFFSIVSIMLYWIDSFSIGYFRNATEVGFYNAAVPIALILLFAPELFMQLFFPLINRYYSMKKFKLIKEISQQVGKWIFIINLPVFLLMILFPGTIINILFGQQYLIAENALRLLAIGATFSSMSIISNNLLSMVGKSKLILFNILIVSILNIILNIFLVPKFGINGAAFATMVSYILLSLLFMVQARYYLNIIPLRKKVFKILFVAIIPTVLLIYTKQFIEMNLINLVLIGMSFMIIYLSLIFATKCLDENDIMIIKAIKNKFLNNIPSIKK